MHPAYSVILFTTASGAGYGLLIWLALLAAAGGAAHNGRLGFWGLGLAFALIVAGLLSSTLHLGRPERAAKAFSQWRTSWLSREGVLAVATFLPAGLMALLWVFGGGRPVALVVLMAVLTIVLALVTVWCTGMIYQSLPTIRAWAQPIVSPIYVSLALMSGAVLLNALLLLVGLPAGTVTTLALGLLGLGALLKMAYWRRIDTTPKTWTAENATGLGRFGEVRVLEPPHTQANYVMREMGYQVARKHSLKLRAFALGLGFLVPLVLMLAILLLGGGTVATLFAVLAVVFMAIGLITERWLFFAEAQHVVSVFYGAKAA